jgi:hypothetical protein
MLMKEKDLESRFTTHTTHISTQKVMEVVRTSMGAVAVILDAYVPDSRELSLAITHLEEATFWANAGIARAGLVYTLDAEGLPDAIAKER